MATDRGKRKDRPIRPMARDGTIVKATKTNHPMVKHRWLQVSGAREGGGQAE